MLWRSQTSSVRLCFRPSFGARDWTTCLQEKKAVEIPALSSTPDSPTPNTKSDTLSSPTGDLLLYQAVHNQTEPPNGDLELKVSVPPNQLKPPVLKTTTNRPPWTA